MAGKLVGRAILETANLTVQTISVGNSTSNITVNSTSIVAQKIIANGGFGTSGQVLSSNGTGMYWATVSGGGGGGGVGGSDTNIIFNDGGNSNGSAAFTFNKTTNTVSLSNTLSVGGSLTINASALSIGNVTVTATQITVGNSTVNTVLSQTGSVTGDGAGLTSVDALTVGGNTASALRTYSDTVAATAYSNATSYADTKAATAYSNATSYADTKAATAYSNATSYADTVAATAFTNAASRADSAYSNATSYADTKAAAAYSNAISYSGNAAQSYSNAIAYAAANTYVNSTFLPFTGGTLTGNLIINAAANVVGNVSANNATFRGDVQIDGNLTVSGVSVTLNVASLAVEDNMIYLNNGSQVSHPDLGFAGNYNDGSYKHAGFFRDATDGTWKVFDGYTPEPDASAYIDTSNASFRIANFTANVVTANSFAGNGASITSVDAASVGGNTAATLRSYSDTVAATAYSNSTTYSSNADNISSGTLNTARLPATANITTAINVGANVNLSTSQINVGNSTVNSVLTQTALTVGGNVVTVGTAAYHVANGNLGLGTPTPGSKLDVSGTGRFTTIDTTRINPRVVSVADAASITPDVSAGDQYNVTALAQALTINAPTGTPVDGNKLIIRILDNGTARSLSWNGTYTAIGTTIPTTTTLGKMLYVGCIYNSANTRWDVIAVAAEA